MDTASSVFLHLFRGRADCYGSWAGGCIREPLTPEHFHRHLYSVDERDWIGVYNVIDLHCSWGCVDLDIKDLQLARNIHVALGVQDIPAWIESTTRGFHIWVFPADGLIYAKTMRQALTAACHVIGYSPREVFPKQDHALGKSVGNYVRLPMNGAYAAGHRHQPRMFIDGASLRRMDINRATTDDLERVAAMLPRPQRVDISVDTQSGLEVEPFIRQLGGLALRIWRDGPLPGNDRSTTLTSLVHLLHEADVDPTMAYEVAVSADNRWGKGFIDRGESGVEIIRRIIVNAYGVTA